METIKITLEDKGQDFTKIFCDNSGNIINVEPFQKDIWIGSLIPIKDKKMFKVGELLPIHNPPHIIFGFLDHKIEKIEYLTRNLK